MSGLDTINRLVWGLPSIALILGVGIYITVTTRFAQIRFLPKAIKALIRRDSPNQENADKPTSYQALCTAMAATVGTGNLAGVAGAIALGGPGVLFWMWVCGFVGMATKYAEAVLAVRFSERRTDGSVSGGPMYVIINGLGKRWRPMAIAYALFGLVASFGVGNATQINTVIASVKGTIISYGGNYSIVTNMIFGITLAGVVGVMLSGGVRRVNRIAEQLVPVASMFYLVLCACVLFVCRDKIPDAFVAIFTGAFKPNAITGGIIGSAFHALRFGASRGVFTNEAGLGTAAVAHAPAEVKHPVEQGFMGILEVFIDTIVICTITALVILCSGIKIPFGTDPGVNLTNNSFAHICGQWVNLPISLSLCLFALATILGWGYYGECFAEFLFGAKARKTYIGCQIVVVILSACLSTGVVWTVAEIVNGLMIIPNLIALIFLSHELIKLTDDYTNQYKRKYPAHRK